MPEPLPSGISLFEGVFQCEIKQILKIKIRACVSEHFQHLGSRLSKQMLWSHSFLLQEDVIFLKNYRKYFKHFIKLCSCNCQFNSFFLCFHFFARGVSGIFKLQLNQNFHGEKSIYVIANSQHQFDGTLLTNQIRICWSLGVQDRKGGYGDNQKLKVSFVDRWGIFSLLF